MIEFGLLLRVPNKGRGFSDPGSIRMRAILSLLVALVPAQTRAGQARSGIMSNDRGVEILSRTRVVALFATCVALAFMALVFVPEVSLAARVQVTAQLWLLDLWGFMAGLVGGSSLCELLMGSHIYGYGRIDRKTMWTPRSRLNVAFQIMLSLVVSVGIGFCMANEFLYGMHPLPLH